MLKMYKVTEYIDRHICPIIEKEKVVLEKLLQDGFYIEDTFDTKLNDAFHSGDFDRVLKEECGFSRLVDSYVCENGLHGASEEDTKEILNLMKNNGYVLTVDGFDYKLIIVNDELFIPFKFMDYILTESESAVTEIDNIEEADGFTEDDYRKFLKSLWKAGCKLGPNTYEKYKDMIDVLLGKEVPTDDLISFGIAKGNGQYYGGGVAGRFGMVLEGNKFKIICYMTNE